MHSNLVVDGTHDWETAEAKGPLAKDHAYLENHNTIGLSGVEGSLWSCGQYLYPAATHTHTHTHSALITNSLTAVYSRQKMWR